MGIRKSDRIVIGTYELLYSDAVGATGEDRAAYLTQRLAADGYGNVTVTWNGDYVVTAEYR